MSAFDIDPMAAAGYEYATKTGTPRTVTIKTDMDLLAFNAGISNANVRHGLAVAKIAAPGTVQVQKQRDALQVLLNALIAKIKTLRTGQELVCNSFMLLGYDADYADWVEAHHRLRDAGVLECRRVPNGLCGWDYADYLVGPDKLHQVKMG